MRFKLIAAILCVLAPSAQAETLKVALPHKGIWDAAIVEFGVRAGIFKKEGLNLQFSYTRGGSATLQSVLSGSLDVGMQTGVLGLIGAYSKGAPVRVISAATTGAGDLFWYSKTGSGIKSLKDAAGKTISYSEPGSSSNLVLLSLLEQAGVKAKPVHTGGLPGTFTDVMSGQVDIGWAAAPFGLVQIKEGKIHIVARGSDVKAMRDETIRANFVGAGTLAKKHAALVKFSRGYAETLDWAYSHPQVVAGWFAKIQHIPTALAKQAIEEFYPKKDLQPYEIKGLSLNLQQALQYKFISHPMTQKDLKGMIDILYKGGA